MAPWVEEIYPKIRKKDAILQDPEDQKIPKKKERLISQRASKQRSKTCGHKIENNYFCSTRLIWPPKSEGWLFQYTSQQPYGPIQAKAMQKPGT